MVLFVQDFVEPVAVGDEPVEGLLKAGVESPLGAPAQFAPGLGGIEGVTAIVAGTILDVLDERFIAAGQDEKFFGQCEIVDFNFSIEISTVRLRVLKNVVSMGQCVR